VIAHPVDGTQWQHFNDKHKEFSADPRNVRFGLSIDGMNPFNERSSDHSTWSVILTIYNIPTWHPKQAGIDIVVRRESVFSSLFSFWVRNKQALI